PGTTRVKRDEFHDRIADGVAADMLGGPAVGESGQVVGFLTVGSSATAGTSPDVNLVGPDEIRAALKTVSIDPHRGPTDTTYEAAMHNYKNKLYAAAIPSLAQTLGLH